jgi:phytoene dehydrogenase-like protein
VEQTFGVWHVEGGLGELATALQRRCERRGVLTRFGADVAEVTASGGRVDGVRLVDGERVRADVVVSDVDARHLFADLLGSSAARGQRVAATRTAPSSSGLSLQLGLRGRTAGLRHHTVLFPADYDAEFDALFGPRPRPVPDPALYVCAPDDARMRPDDDSESWSVLVNAPPHAPGDARRGVDWSRVDVVQSYVDSLLDSLARRALDVRDRTVWSTVRTPVDVEHDSRSPGGSIYGPSSNGARAAFRRPSNVGPVPGLFLVGGSAHPGGGLPLVGLSAEIVAGLVGPA